MWWRFILFVLVLCVLCSAQQVSFTLHPRTKDTYTIHPILAADLTAKLAPGSKVPTKSVYNCRLYSREERDPKDQFKRDVIMLDCGDGVVLQIESILFQAK